MALLDEGVSHNNGTSKKVTDVKNSFETQEDLNE